MKQKCLRMYLISNFVVLKENKKLNHTHTHVNSVFEWLKWKQSWVGIGISNQQNVSKRNDFSLTYLFI